MAKITQTFSTPMYWDEYPQAKQLNERLHELFLDREGDPGITNPNPYTARNEQLFESHFDLFKWPDASVQELKRYCLGAVLANVQQLNGYTNEFMQRVQVQCDSWFHVTRHGGFFGIHNHPMASWSGVYCVSSGQPENTRPDNGALTFLNPFILPNMFIDAGNAQMQGPFTTSSMMYQLKPGQLVLFPSWMLHEVKTFLGQGERITVAFNCWFHLR